MYNTVIIGAGSIGALKPDKYDTPKNDKKILTIAHACYLNENINLIGIVDKNLTKAKKAAKKWKTTAYSDVYEIRKKIDIIFVCVNTPHHFEVLQDIIFTRPKLVMCEKPFCSNLQEAKEISDLYKHKKIQLLVNYSRRYLKTFERILTMEHGKILSCILYYTRGIRREASHAIDLFNWFLGDCITGARFSDYKFNDFADYDLTESIHLEYEKCKNVLLIPIDGRETSIYEIDIITTNRRIRIINSGKIIETYKNTTEQIYGNYKALSPNKIQYVTDLHINMKYVVQNAIDSIKNSKVAKCTYTDGLNVHHVFEKIYGAKK